MKMQESIAIRTKVTTLGAEDDGQCLAVIVILTKSLRNIQMREKETTDSKLISDSMHGTNWLSFTRSHFCMRITETGNLLLPQRDWEKQRQRVLMHKLTGK
jgi:hypothetical protein